MIENYKIIPIGKAKDIRGQRFNKLIVLDRVENKGKQTQWLCQCDCGNKIIATGTHLKDNHIQSCGCLKHSPLDDISGQRFGKLVVLNYDHTKGKGHTYWKCKCDCGKEFISRKDALISGKTVSCGCYKNELISLRTAEKLEGQKFGKLTVIKRQGSNKFYNALWLCQCECGNQCIVDTHSLKSGNTKSCGCLISNGERVISNLLRENKIFFETQKTFESCKFLDTNRQAKFDFYINNTYLLEFDGIQHYSFTNQDWNTEAKFFKTKEHDKLKNEWCKNNQIPLIRIPYWKLNTLCLEDLLLETTNYLVKDE